MSAHASQAFSIAHCTNSEDFPILRNFSQFYTFCIAQMRNGYGVKTRGLGQWLGLWLWLQ